MRGISKQPDNEIQSLTSTKTTALQNRVALLVGIVLVCVCILAYPYARDGGPKVPAVYLIFTIPAIFAALLESIQKWVLEIQLTPVFECPPS